MRNNSTIASLKAMRFSAMAAELERQMQDSSVYSQMGFEERLSLLVDAEWNSRQNNKLLRCIRNNAVHVKAQQRAANVALGAPCA